MGRSILIKQALLERAEVPLSAASFCKILWVDEAIADARFIHGILDNLYRSGEIERFQTQSTGLRNLRTKQLLAEFRFGLPPIDAQRRIAAVLSAFDELIEINERRIELLEDLARSLYREWFVHFRFPGHEDVELVDSELGPIPEGWEVQSLGDIAELRYGKTLPAKTRRPGKVPVVSSAGVIATHDHALVGGPGIVIGRKGNVGSVWWVEDDFFPIDTTYYVKSDLPLGFLYWKLQSLEFIDSHAAVPGLSRAQATALTLVVPGQRVAQNFDKLNDAIALAAAGFRATNRQLAATRDLLLPRLVTGRLDISDIDLGILTPAEVE